MNAGRQTPDVGPAGWELPAAAVLVWLTAGALLLPVGRAVAALLTGGGWVWPGRSGTLVAAVGGLLTGDTAAGLTAAQVAALPSPAAVYTGVTAVLILFLAGSAAAAWAGHRWLITRAGMATRGQVTEVLGVARLRKVAPVTRPDRHPGSRASDTDVGWRLGAGVVPAAGELWVPYDRTTGVYGPQGSGKTLDLLAPTLLDARRRTGSRSSTHHADPAPGRGHCAPVLAAVKVVRPVGRSTLTAAPGRQKPQLPGAGGTDQLTRGPSTDRALRVPAGWACGPTLPPARRSRREAGCGEADAVVVSTRERQPHVGERTKPGIRQRLGCFHGLNLLGPAGVSGGADQTAGRLSEGSASRV